MGGESSEKESPVSRARTLIRLAVGAAVVAGVAKALQARRAEPVWHSVPVAVPDAPSQKSAQKPAPKSVEPAPSAGHADDAAGSSPDEAAADQVEAPHVPTTPDAPAEIVVLEE